MVQRCIYTVNVVKKPVKIQFFERFHWRNESKANEGTKARHKRKNKLNMFLWNRFITCFNGPHHRLLYICFIPAIRPYIVNFLSDYSLLYPQPLHRLRVVFAHENRTKGGLFQEEPVHNCFLEDDLVSCCYETFCVLSDQCSAYCTCNKNRNQQQKITKVLKMDAVVAYAVWTTKQLFTYENKQTNLVVSRGFPLLPNHDQVDPYRELRWNNTALILHRICARAKSFCFHYWHNVALCGVQYYVIQFTFKLLKLWQSK